MEINTIYKGNALPVLKTFPDECMDMCVTSLLTNTTTCGIIE